MTAPVPVYRLPMSVRRPSTGQDGRHTGQYQPWPNLLAGIDPHRNRFFGLGRIRTYTRLGAAHGYHSTWKMSKFPPTEGFLSGLSAGLRRTLCIAADWEAKQIRVRQSAPTVRHGTLIVNKCHRSFVLHLRL